MLPELFKIGPITISAYGVLVATGFFLGLFLATRLGVKYEHLDKKIIWDFGITTVFIAIVGAKVLLIFTDPYFYNNISNIFSMDFLRSGGVFYGGFIGAILWAIWYFHHHKLDGWRFSDALAPGIPLGHTLGRLGCFSAGCCHGRPTHSFLGVVFTNPNCMVLPKYLGIPIYPTQLMEATTNFITFLILFYLYKKKSFHGQMILLYVMMYAAARFVIEFFRGDPRGWVLHGILSTSQFIALLAFPTALIFYLIRRKRPECQVSTK